MALCYNNTVGKKALNKEALILKQSKRLDRISLVLSINMCLAVLAILALLFFIKGEFKGFDITKLWDFFAKLNWIKAATLIALLAGAIADIALSAFFIRFLPQKKKRKAAQKIIDTGEGGTGKIVKMEVFRKSIYEIKYKAILRLEDGHEVFCFYSVDKTEPLPLGEMWELYYDKESNFAVLNQRLSTSA